MPAGAGRGSRTAACVDHDRGGVRPQFRGERHRIGLQRQQVAVAADDLELVVVAGARPGHEDFPEAVAAHPHGVAAAVPEIEVADHADALRSRREDREGDALDAVEHHRMGAELVVEAQMRAFAEQVQIEIGQDRRKAVGVLDSTVVAERARRR